ncbi:MAG: carotenoid oxygenase family protein [Rubrivivax sp.]|nr:carotenoid oxygenase family protein [Rubrivivax sp.]
MVAGRAPAQVRRGRERGFLGLSRVFDDATLHVTGTLPPCLQGSLLLNGPALRDLPGGALRHWFDGYAMLHRLRIGGGRVRYRRRFVQSDACLRSTAIGVLVKGEFGSPTPASLWARLLGSKGTDSPAVVMSRHGTRWTAVSETP